MDFSALQESPSEQPEIGQSLSTNAPLPSAPEPAATPKKEGAFQVRGKWLQFDCPHCIRPMRLVVEDAGGLVDCAHCGLELIAPDPAIGRGAQLSRASEGRIGSLSRFNLKEMRGDQLRHSKSKEDEAQLYGTVDAEDDDYEEEEALDPNHALSRAAPATPAERKSAVKALESGKLGRSFRRQEIIAEQASAASDTEWDPNTTSRPSFGESRQDRYGFWIALGVASAVMLGIVALVIREAGNSGEVFDDAQMQAIQAAKAEKTSRFKGSFDTAKLALESATWEDLAPHMREPERVVPLMRSYYAEVPYEPITLTEFHAPVAVEVGGLAMHEIRVTQASGESRTLVLELSEDGAKIDWELMVNLPKHDWINFLETRPEDPRTIRVIASRSSVLDRYFTDAGLTRNEAIGIRLWHGTADSQFAILPNGSEMAEKMAELLQWETGRKIIIEASFDPKSELNDRVRIDGFVQTGWVIE